MEHLRLLRGVTETIIALRPYVTQRLHHMFTVLRKSHKVNGTVLLEDLPPCKHSEVDHTKEKGRPTPISELTACDSCSAWLSLMVSLHESGNTTCLNVSRKPNATPQQLHTHHRFGVRTWPSHPRCSPTTFDLAGGATS